MRRVQQLHLHVCPSALTEAVEPAAEMTPGASADKLALLSEEQLFAYTRDGFYTAQISELPDSFHSAFGARMREFWEGPGGQGEAEWLALEPALLELLRTPTFKGAMSSILGADYQMAAPWCNRPGQGGMIGLHVTPAESFGHDQNFHKVTGLRLL